MTGDNGDPVNFLDLVRHIRESAIVVWNEMDTNKNGYIDYKGNLLKGIGHPWLERILRSKSSE